MNPCTWQSFQPKWSGEPHIPGGVYLPEDKGQRTSVVRVPRGVIDALSTNKDTAHKQTHQPKPANYLEGFLLFKKLPPEIRHMIWKYTLPGPRVLELLYNQDKGACTTACRAPDALFVCAESREIAMKRFQRSFATARAPALTYIDFAVDTVYLGVGNSSPDPQATIDLIHALQPEDVSKIHDLAVDDLIIYDYGKIWQDQEYWELFDRVNDPYSSMDYLLKGLRSLTFVTNSSHSHPGHSSKFSQFHSDIILAEVEENPGECQAWSLSPDEDAKQWKLPLGQSTWELHISEFWAYLESRKRETEGFPLKTARWVTLKQLSHQAKWAERLRYCGRHKKYMEGTGCVYDCVPGSTLETLLKLKGKESYLDLERELHGAMQQKTARDLKDVDIDPIEVYLSTHYCVCAIGHARRTDLLGFSTEELAALDLENRVRESLSGSLHLDSKDK